MHHSVSLTTNFVKNFFPNNGLTQSSQQSSSVEPEPAVLHQQQQPEQPEQQQLPQQPEPTMNSSITTQVSSPINRSVEESAPVESQPVVAAVEKKTVSIEDFNLAKFKYEQLKVSNNYYY